MAQPVVFAVTNLFGAEPDFFPLNLSGPWRLEVPVSLRVLLSLPDLAIPQARPASFARRTRVRRSLGAGVALFAGFTGFALGSVFAVRSLGTGVAAFAGSSRRTVFATVALIALGANFARDAAGTVVALFALACSPRGSLLAGRSLGTR